VRREVQNGFEGYVAGGVSGQAVEAEGGFFFG